MSIKGIVKNNPVQDENARSTLTPHQQDAFKKLMAFVDSENNNMALLEGYAGTGKTYLMGEFLSELSGRLSVCVAAPTHKALKVICATLEHHNLVFGAKTSSHESERGGMFNFIENKTNETGLFAATVHSLLALKLIEREDGTTTCERNEGKIPTFPDYNLVVIDEASLISRAMFELIATCLHENNSQFKRTKVLFIGDPAQLPPVDDKGIISPVFTHVLYKAALSEVVRQAKDSPIIKLSMAIREKVGKFGKGDFTQELPPLPANAACLSGNADTLINFSVMEHKEGRDARILCYRNQSVSRFNQSVHEQLHPGTVFAPGEKVLVYYCAGHGEMESSPIKEYEKEEDLLGGEEYKARVMEEFKVIECEPGFSNYGVDLVQLLLESETGLRLITRMPVDMNRHNREIGKVWADYRKVNTLWLSEQDSYRKSELREKKKELSGKAWAMKKAYPDLRHAYAMTVHRSQGSTFDTVLVNYPDINIMKSAFEFNRALYVACTRPRQYLAVIV